MTNSIEDLPGSDCSLVGQTWVNEGRDLLLTVALADGHRVAIIYTWVTGLACELSYPQDTGGPPLTRDVTYTQSGHRRTALWDFASRGSLEYTFEDATYTEADG